MSSLFWAAALFTMYDSRALADLCISGDTLDQHIALSPAGCTEGTQTVHDFSFIGAQDITVLIPPDITSGATDGIEFVSDLFSVSGAGFVNYRIGYTWDPSGDLRDILDDGLVDVNTGLCVGSGLSAGPSAPSSTFIRMILGRDGSSMVHLAGKAGPGRDAVLHWTIPAHNRLRCRREFGRSDKIKTVYGYAHKLRSHWVSDTPGWQARNRGGISMAFLWRCVVGSAGCAQSVAADQRHH